MKIRILGDGLEAWTIAAVFASTGCHVELASNMKLAVNMTSASFLSDIEKQNNSLKNELVEPDLIRLIVEQKDRLTVIPQDNEYRDHIDILLDARLDAAEEKHLIALERYANFCSENNNLGVYVLTQPVKVGATDALEERLKNTGLTCIDCVYWPLFIESGRAVESYVTAERYIIGGGCEESQNKIKQLIYPFNRNNSSIMLMPAKAAEMTKLAINGMLATRVSFMNELAALASEHEVDIDFVRQGLGSDPRIGSQYLYPGCGFGGDAFLNTLNHLSEEFERGKESKKYNLLSSVWEINQQQKDLLFQKFWRYFNADIKGCSVAIWGCAFKPETASIIGSAALELIPSLLAHDVFIKIYDPVAANSVQSWLGEHPLVEYSSSPEESAQDVNAIMLLTDWKIFWNLDLRSIAKLMRTPLLLDGRNIYDPEQARTSGLIYSGIGRGETI
jgi:UDPglucose 6-dehydrogenase